MEPSDINPLISYNKFIGQNDLSFSFEKISMKQLSKVINGMKATGSSSADNISMWLIKQGKEYLQPLLLHLITKIIESGIYPTNLKTTKIVPVRKPSKDETTNFTGFLDFETVHYSKHSTLE